MSTNEGELRMRQIKASEVKPGMRVRFEMDGWHVEGTVSRVEPVTFGLEFYSTQGVEMTLGEDSPVTVLAGAQPEAPTAFGACVETPHWTDEHGCNRFVWDNLWWRCGRDDGYMWEALTAGGAVEVISPDPFARSEEAPERTPDAPEVPDRITEWPEDDTALRAYPWRDALGIVWRYGVPGREHGWSTGSSRAWKGLIYGPWHREKGAEVPDRIEEWPEDDTALRPYPWRDSGGDTWTWTAAASAWVCRDAEGNYYVESTGRPSCGPWDRSTAR